MHSFWKLRLDYLSHSVQSRECESSAMSLPPPATMMAISLKIDRTARPLPPSIIWTVYFINQAKISLKRNPFLCHCDRVAPHQRCSMSYWKLVFVLFFDGIFKVLQNFTGNSFMLTILRKSIFKMRKLKSQLSHNVKLTLTLLKCSFQIAPKQVDQNIFSCWILRENWLNKFFSFLALQTFTTISNRMISRMYFFKATLDWETHNFSLNILYFLINYPFTA